MLLGLRRKNNVANISILDGRLVADPELRQSQSGVSVTTFTIAVPRSYAPKDGERQADFIDIVAWRKSAEFVCEYFMKGKWIQVVGELQTRTYEDKEKKKRKVFEVVANSVSFVGDKAKDDTSAGARSATPPPPKGVDPFGSAPAYQSGGADNFTEPDEDGDLPF
jgi:single-strand DNA-binding protein